MQFVRLGSYYAFIAWIPIFIQEEYGLDLLVAGTVFSLFNWAGMLSNPLGGFISDRKGEKLVLLTSFMAVALTIFLFVGMKTTLILYIGVFTIGWFISFVRSPIFSIIPKLWGADTAGQVSGIHNTLASIGALALPFLLGYIKDSTGSYYLGWMALSLLLISATLLNLFIKK
jgi:NNP family nitrate/nitrite transporter-like MFS transporter